MTDQLPIGWEIRNIQYECDDFPMKIRRKIMTSDQFMSIVRGVLNIGGGALVSQGIVSGSNMVTITGVVTGIAGLAWGTFVHAPTQIVKAAETVKAKGLV